MTLTTLVAGGGGFLGSHLCTALVEDGREVICIDNFGSGRRENIAHLEDHPRFMLIEADIREPLGLPAADRVYHLASRASPTDFTEFPVQIALTNTEGTRNLLDYAVKHDARMVYASTSEVYGNPEVHPQPESYSGNVNIRGPRGCYDESKRFGETLTVAYEERYDIDVRTARIFNTYGPRMRADDGRVVPTFVRQALDGEDLTIYGDGTQTRSFCYVTDMVSGLRALMDQPDIDGEVVNIGRENEITIRTLADRILELCDTDSDLTFDSLPEDDPERRRPDISKAKELLDWEPNVSLNEGLRQTISSFESK
ncbi:UDP-glucuronic acid decarboxylase family protein [Haloarcula argentinensis]|uniref:Epimerase n=1 Tax=Haloarcula argentinensis TaxID=43776 RepID=A0A830FPX5_HALAR|nr:UDP-glucuronic acid decarboxylase family protein [Haloarcula argentinensis]EMA18461.1 nucleoside-diphosphate-sugar epimerase [Haloarcula argentinensis DSM 12282]MDS0253978.1 SDR family oxidoreductase [Haloarcula argentinensis]GGM45070.1 epimerase [Haloarcula argentinensis]